MEIQKNFYLTNLNTLHVVATAKYFVEIKSEEELQELFNLPEYKQNPKIFLGGGSNILFTKDFDGLVVLNKLKGIRILNEDGESVLVRSMSGEVWHDVVLFAVDHDYWGIENLAFVPGTVGAAPMQNIGAYGAELKNVLENVETIDVETGAQRVFNKEECLLGYRDSVFKNTLRGKYFISAVTVRLSKVEKKNLSYKILQEYVEQNKITIKTPRDISDAVTSIRKSKLPDPNVIGNAGSFFKNPFVNEEKLNSLLQTYPEMPYFKEENKIKIPAAWMIEQCGWKGKKFGNIGVHEKHALVLVNHGGGNGQELKKLAYEIIDSVDSKFGLKLEPEVNLI